MRSISTSNSYKDSSNKDKMESYKISGWEFVPGVLGKE